jgi:hypothetical protein
MSIHRNLNNFETVKECEMVCDVMIDMAKLALGKALLKINFNHIHSFLLFF